MRRGALLALALMSLAAFGAQAQTAAALGLAAPAAVLMASEAEA